MNIWIGWKRGPVVMNAEKWPSYPPDDYPQYPIWEAWFMLLKYGYENLELLKKQEG